MNQQTISPTHSLIVSDIDDKFQGEISAVNYIGFTVDCYALIYTRCQVKMYVYVRVFVCGNEVSVTGRKVGGDIYKNKKNK